MKSIRLLPLLICLMLALSLALTSCSAPAAQEHEPITIIAASDFQHHDGNEAGQAVINGIVDSIMANGITSADGFMFCGDYAQTFGSTDDTIGGIAAISESVSPLVSDNMYFLQGNHDAAIGTEGLRLSGDNDHEDDSYGVFIINEDDYMWYNDNEATVKHTAQNLIEYLNEKIVIAYDRPIFVMSHLPLHYSMRTKVDGDAKYAYYIFNALNEAGKKGLNIIFMFGHDHSNGWDDYIGGASVYLAKGDSMLVAQGSNDEYKAETLHFTYFNPGYVGYYNNVNGSDGTLSMSVITVTGDSISISRYSADGVHNLKSAGVTNKQWNESGYDPDPTVYASPQTINLTKVTDSSLIKNLIEEPTEGEGGKYIRVTNANKIKDGSRYLLVYNSSSSFIMLPSVVTKENNNGAKRIGFNVEKASAFETDTVYGQYTGKEWTFTEADGGWLLGSDEGYAKFTSTSDTAITATLESEGDVFVIGGSENAFTFTTGSMVLNYNSRGLINGYESNPATFYIYEFAGYTVNVTNGKANKEDAVEGETVKLTADKAPNGKVFSKWTVIAGNVVLEDEYNASTGFVMPAGEVRIVATYTDK